MSSATATIEAIKASGGGAEIDTRTGQIKLRVMRFKALPPDLQHMARKYRDEIVKHLVSSVTSVGLLRQLGIDYQVITDDAAARQTAQWLLDDEKQRCEVADKVGTGLTGIDFETMAANPDDDAVLSVFSVAAIDPLRGRVRLIQVWPMGGTTVFIFDMSTLSADAVAGLWQLKGLVAHNAMFELRYIDLHYQRPAPQIRCSMAAAGLSSGNNFTSLADLALSELGLIVPKTMQVSDWSVPGLTDEQLAYAAIDAVLAPRVFVPAMLAVPSAGPLMNAMMRAMPCLAWMINTGVRIDADRHNKLRTEWQLEYDDAFGQWHALHPDVDPTKDRAIEAWIRAELTDDELHAWPKTRKSNKMRLDAGVLAEHADRLPGVESILRLRRVMKLLSTYGGSLAAFVHPVDGAIHSELKIGGARTGRMSSSKPNMQNAPRSDNFRAIFKPAPGRVFVVADWSCMEVRAAAEESGDQAMLQVFADGADFHKATVARINGKPIGEITTEERQAAKPLAFGLLYGMGPAALSDYAYNSYGIKLTLTEAAKLRDAFFRAYPQFRQWQKTQSRKVAGSPGMLAHTRLGRPVECTKSVEDGGPFHYTRSLNVPIQGSCAEALLEALAALPAAITDLDAAPALCVHDEIILSVAETDAEEAARRLERVMAKAFLRIYPNHPDIGLAEASIGPDWAEAKP